MQVKLALMLWLALATCMTGCTSTLPSLPPTPVRSAVSTPARQAENAVYTIGPDDVLAITVYNQPDLSTHATVTPDGSFSYPLVGTVRAAGLSTQQLEKRMTEMFATYLVAPQVTVTMEQFKSQQVNVIGEVKTPGTYPLRRESTLLEVLLQAGGATANAGGNVLLVRAPGGAPSAGKGADRGSKSEDITQVNLEDVLAGKPSQRILVYSGDTVYVPEKGSVYVSGEVLRPGRYPMEKDTTVMKAITLAGGFTPFAAKNSVRVKRVVEGSPRDFQAKTDDLLQTGDVLIVPASLF
jgi:polysaccharide export outer membrane protein